MNPKLQKLKSEREKNDRKIVVLRERNKRIDERKLMTKPYND